MSIKKAVFYLDDEEYGMDIADINIIEKNLKIEKVVNSPKNIKGKADIRGVKIPVYSLRSKFGIEDKQPDVNTRYLIVDVDGRKIAYEVDNVKGIVDIEPVHTYDVPYIVKADKTSYLDSIAYNEGGLVLILDSKLLIDNDEMKFIKDKIK
ncbi:MAG: hypothetical protein GX319_01625 [Clostridiales bacterium]|jgi:purine-binding chemotaxis protein CheW|nr:chemotaxis protein CheW [Bacillota bacterium]NLK03091.1 hypothetical protein [Clostridiales bacterium]